jgi:hypothetical protein
VRIRTSAVAGPPRQVTPTIEKSWPVIGPVRAARAPLRTRSALGSALAAAGAAYADPADMPTAADPSKKPRLLGVALPMIASMA